MLMVVHQRRHVMNVYTALYSQSTSPGQMTPADSGKLLKTPGQ